MRSPPGLQGRPGQVRADLLVPLPGRCLRGYQAGTRLHVLPGVGLLLRDADTAERLDLGTEVELTHLRTEMTSERQALADVPRWARCSTSSAREADGQQELDIEHLSSIVDDAQRTLRHGARRRRPAAVRPVRGELARRRRSGRPGPQQHIENFRLVFDKQVPPDGRRPHGRQRGDLQEILDDEDFRAALGEFYLRKIYERLRDQG